MRKKKERAVKYFSVFLLFMLALTILSRGIYAWQMPKVTTGTAEARALSRNITAEGTVLTKDEVPVVACAGVLVEKVCVVEGQKVEAGDLLMQLSMEDLEALIGQADLQIQAEEAKLAELNASGAAAVSRASQDLENAKNSAAGAVSQADEDYRAAASERDAFPSEEQYLEQAYKKDAEYQKLLRAAKKKNAKKADKEAFEFYKKSLDASLLESYSQQKRALDAAVSEKEAAVREAGAGMEEAVRQAQRNLEDAKLGEGGGTKIEQQNQLCLLKEQREAYLAVKQAQGKITSDIPGHVARIQIRAGERAADTAAIVLSDAAGDKMFQAVLPPEEKEGVAAGDKISLLFLKEGKQIRGVPIEAAGELEDGSLKVTVKISDPGVKIGDLGKMELIQDLGRHACVIPKDALHTDGGTDYVLIVEEQETILGTELVARKRKVKVADRDEEYVALADGEISEEEKFVLDYDKEISDGERIRLKE